MDTKLRGSWGEALAMAYLRRKDYEPVGMGYRTRYGEIDVIVKDGAYIAFVEVKVRKNDRYARRANSWVPGNGSACAGRPSCGLPSTTRRSSRASTSSRSTRPTARRRKARGSTT